MIVRLESRRIAGAAEVRVEVVDAGVEDGDLDAAPGAAKIAPGTVPVDVLDAGDVVELERPRRLDALDARKRGEGRHVLQRRPDGQAVVGVLVGEEHPATGGLDPTPEPVLRRP